MKVTRRQFLASAAVTGLGTMVACSSSQTPQPTPSVSKVPAIPPNLLWAEEFDVLDLATVANPAGRWRTNDRSLTKGYADFGSGGHSTWCVNPSEVLGGQRYTPFEVANSVLSITVRRTPTKVLSAVNGCPWMGGMLISNEVPFTYGYFEFRVRFPQIGRGMFPALWFYAVPGLNPPDHSAAEIDLLEVYGDASGSPWFTSLHETVNGQNSDMPIQTRHDDVRDWHTYGLHWEPGWLGFYVDRKRTASLVGPQASYMDGTKMSIRLDYVMDAEFFVPANRSDGSGPDKLSMEVDYVRQYDRPF